MPALPFPRQRPRWTWKEAHQWILVNDHGKAELVWDAPFGADTTVDATEMEGGQRHPIHIRHRNAIVCTYLDDGTTILNPGRLRTKGIRDRLCCYSRANVFERDGIWFMAAPGNPDEVWPFVDGMAIDEAGRPVGRKAEALEPVAGLKVCPECKGDGVVE